MTAHTHTLHVQPIMHSSFVTHNLLEKKPLEFVLVVMQAINFQSLQTTMNHRFFCLMIKSSREKLMQL